LDLRGDSVELNPIAMVELSVSGTSREWQLNSVNDDDLMHVNERLTVLRAQQGDREAFSRLVDSYDKRLLYFVRSILGNAEGALDILQAVWLIVHRKLRELESPDAFRVWLYRIVHHQAVSYLRKRSKYPVIVEQCETIPEANSASVTELMFDNAEMVHVAMQGLSVDHRRVLTLRFLEDMTIDQIAKVIDCSPGTVKSRLHYAKDALRRRIEEQLNG
jgi:RNA polymerase sigma-70 factor (ECF subfamily)